MAPDVDVEPLTLKDPTLEVDHIALRPKPKRPPKKGAGVLAWIVAIVLIAGIGAVVAFVLMRDSGTTGGGETGATSEPAKTTETGATKEAGSDASSATTEETAEAAAADATEETVAAEETQAAAADAAGETGEDAAVAAADDAVAEGGEETQAASDDAVTDETSLAGADATESTDAAVAAVDDTAAPTEDGAAVAVDDAASAPEDAAVAALADAPAPVGDAAVASVADAVPVDVVVAVKIDPAESKRLNDLGFAARKAGDHATARARYKEAVAADPENVWARYNYACELALAKQPKDALNELVAIHKLGTLEAKKALAAARNDDDFKSLKDLGQFVRLTR